jgi:hypothetical protein
MKKQFYLYLIFAMVFSSVVTYFLCKKSIQVNNKVLIANDSIALLKENITNYKKLIAVVNDYFENEKNDLEFGENLLNSSDVLIKNTISNLTFNTKSGANKALKTEKPIRIDTLIQVQEDIHTIEALKKATEALEDTKRKLDEIQNESAVLNLVSSKGKEFQYIGQTNLGVAEGYGVAVFETGSIYKGDWKNNMRHGKGIFKWKDKEFYQGAFLEDKRHGYGEYHWKNGEVYKGFWSNDQRHGEGKLYKKNGKLKIEGTWENDALK